MKTPPLNGCAIAPQAVAYVNELLGDNLVSTRTITLSYPGSIRFDVKRSHKDPYNTFATLEPRFVEKLGCTAHRSESGTEHYNYTALIWDIDAEKSIELRVSLRGVSVRLLDTAHTRRPQ
jgi:hypothetical protein